jgi:hypothetical protein
MSRDEAADSQTVRGVDELRRLVALRHGRVGTVLLNDAYRLAAAAHAGQRRRSGRPFIEHPLAVAVTVADLDAPLSWVCAALLHDVSQAGIEMAWLRARVGDDVTDLVEATAALDLPGALESAPVLTPGMRAALTLKIADKLHNARTMSAIPHQARIRLCRQLLDILAPAASALGLREVSDELNTLARAALITDTKAGPLHGPGRIDSRQALGDLVPPSGEGTPSALLTWLLERAVLTLPAPDRHRYYEEWSAELQSSPRRTLTAIGQLYSAIRLRRR